MDKLKFLLLIFPLIIVHVQQLDETYLDSLPDDTLKICRESRSES